MALRRIRNKAVDTPRALTAATAQVNLSPDSSWKTWRFGNTDWQTEAWRLYDLIPEQKKLTGRIGDSVSQARLYVAELDETGEGTAETTDPTIRALANVPLGTGAQRDENLRLTGVQLGNAGETWIVGEGAAKNPEKAEGQWFVVTGAAINREGGKVKVTRPQQRGGSTITLTDGVDVLIRCWNAHPNDVNQADSFVRSAIPVLREIELLTKRTFAELDSRLTGAGMMFVPEGMDFPREDGDPEGVAGLMALLQRVAAASIQDQSTASAMVPIMVSVPDEVMQYVSDMKPTNFWSDLSAEISNLKDKAIARVAASAEIPAEVVTGMGDANHWSAWLISDEGIRWIKRYLSLISDALTRGFLRPALISMGVANPERYAFAFDTSELAAKPNRIDDATALHDRFLISDQEMVRAAAFDPEQMPSTTERATQILLKLVQSQPDLILDPAVQAALGLPNVRSVGLPATADQNADGDTPDTDPEQSGPPNGGNPPQVPSPGETSEIEAALNRRIELASQRALPALPTPEVYFTAASKQIVMRALEMAGGRLATPAERKGRWRDVPRHEIHAHVGPITPDRAARVTEGAWTHLPMAAADLGVDPDDLHRLLSGYVQSLLVFGKPHHDDLLYDALRIANRGKGLVAA